MSQHLNAVTLVVNDYDEAITYFTEKLGFALVEDTALNEDKRWVLVRPHGGHTSLLLAKAANASQTQRVGDQTGGRVFLFLHTDDFWRDYESYRTRGVKFLEEPRREPYGIVAVFADLYGNKWDLIQQSDSIP